VSNENCNTFDYIIVGAGTSGGVIAKKLTDDKCVSVLVIEAGTNMENSSPSIIDADLVANDNKFSYNILSQTEEAIGRQSRLRNGRVIGGSSQHNFMQAVRGSKDFYDNLGTMFGSQWGYNSVKPLFKKNETYTGNTEDENERGTKGPIFVRQQIIPPDGIINTLTQALSDILGLPIVEDYNTGVGECTFLKQQYTQEEVGDGFVRSSTATGYLNKNIVTQSNEIESIEYGICGRKLVILTKSTVNKVIIEKRNNVKVAVGVEFSKNGICKKAYAKKGVILSAGIFSSAILQRSGIGKFEDLAKVGVKTLVYSPNVGYNLQSQFFAGMGVEVETSRLLSVLSVDPLPLIMGAFQRDLLESRRLQLIGLPAPVLIPIQDVFINNWTLDVSKPTNVMSVAIVDLNPRSRGKIMISHSDPEAYPSIELNPLENVDDLNYMIEKYIDIFDVFMEARKLDPAGVYNVVYPSEDIFNLPDESEKRRILANYVRASYTNTDHYGGQCKMGNDISDGVVDGYLNVFGVENLKVADLSILPILPDGNTGIPAQMIGLNAVRFIKLGI